MDRASRISGLKCFYRKRGSQRDTGAFPLEKPEIHIYEENMVDTHHVCHERKSKFQHCECGAVGEQGTGHGSHCKLIRLGDI